MKRIIAYALLTFLLGCQTIKTSSTANPEVNITPIDTIVVLTNNNIPLELDIVNILNRQEILAYSGKELSTFTNSWDEFKNLMVKQNINYLLLVNSNVGGEHTTMLGTTSHTNTTGTVSNSTQSSNPYFVSSNGMQSTWNLNSNSYTTTTPIYNSTNYATSEATLINSDGIKMWHATINIDSQGTFYTKHSKMIKGLTKGIIKELKKNNLIK